MVSERFLVLSAAIQPTPAGIAKAQSHISTIKSRLKTSFGVNRLVPIGSVSRNTSIRGWSDVDLLAVFSRSDARWGKDYVNSDTFVKRIRQDLEDRFHATTIRKDSQAIVRNRAINPVLLSAQRGAGQFSDSVTSAPGSRFHGSSASISATVLAAGKSRRILRR